MVLLGVTCQREQLLRSVSGFQSALPFIRCSSCLAQPRSRDGKIHVLQHGLDRETVAAQYVFDFIPALERSERVEVMSEKVLPLYCARLRQHFQCFRRPTNLV